MEQNLSAFLAKLRKKATKIGASYITIISIEDAVIEYCKEPLCASYGKSAHCPPHALKPVEARKLLQPFQKALLFKMVLVS